jgi:predicted Rossmann fold nucleotide-binding protein DprA/Smf involved in DNA uptake
MESSVTGNLLKNGQKVIDKVDDLHGDAAATLTKAVSRAQSIGRQSIDAISEMASQAQNVASNASDSIVAYTKKNPVTALTIAAASGALLYAAIKALTPSRK